jgi:esterase/lipase superfamily enzyme
MKRAKIAFALLTVIMLGGCAGPRLLMPTPNLYAAGHEQLFENIADELKDPSVQLLYMTDRVPEKNEEGEFAYGFGRSSSVGFGTATIELGDGNSWDRLLEQSLSRERDEPVDLRMANLQEFGRFPPTPFPFTVRDGLIEINAKVAGEARAREAEFNAHLVRRLALTPQKEVWVYIHGYNNSFADAAYTLAELWHFLGREGVPVLYTWPAGRGGLKGYAYDRESGEFTAYHLKQLFKALGKNEAVQNVKVIAHSRGTDITLTALRELFIEARAAGTNPLDQFKIASLVLAAPDIDFSIIKQRVMTEPIGPGVGHFTLYVSQGDRALGLAEWLFGGLTRIGRLQFADLGKQQIDVMENVGGLDIVDLRGEGGAFGHGYFHTNPAASSDLILAMRYGRKAGAQYGRPLKNIGQNFWAVEDEYLLMQSPERGASPKLVPTPSQTTRCVGKRPEMCAQNYVPVCGTHDPNFATSWKTYSNACMACANFAVRGYRAGACDNQ